MPMAPQEDEAGSSAFLEKSAQKTYTNALKL
jgi:hypothetical protein